MPQRDNGFDKDRERARRAGKKTKRRPYDQIRRERLEELIEREIKRADGSTRKVKMSRDDWYDLAMDTLIMNRESGAVSAVKEQRNRAYGQAPLHLKFDEGETKDPLEGVPLAVLRRIEKMVEKHRAD